MAGKLTTFEENVAVSSGPLKGQYPWSYSANWSYGVPAPGDNVSLSAVPSYDDIESLDLASLSLGANDVAVTGSELTVSAVASAGGLLYADATDAGAPVTVTVGTITGAGGEYGAQGPGASFLDQSAIDTGNLYDAYSGGFTELWAAAASGSTLGYLGMGAFALKNPGATNAVAITGVGNGDVLELPGSSLSNVSFDANSLTVTTNAGTYAFTNVHGNVNSYTAAYDITTGLEAITFGGPDVFAANVASASARPVGGYLWSNSANWSDGAPVQGDSVSVSAAGGIDDIDSLNLASLSLGGNGVAVIGSELTVSTVAGAGGVLYADATDAGGPVTVTVGTITGTGGKYGAQGTGASFLDQSAIDTSNQYVAAQGGFTELWAAPASGSTMGYGGAGTFALKNPSAANAMAITGVGDDDVLELPGSSVSNVAFGANNLTVTTNAGTYTFTNVSYEQTIKSYAAAYDITTGLEAITFGGPDVFADNVAATGGPLAGQYLWSNSANWSNGAPVPGDSVSIPADLPGFDPIASLDLASLTLSYLSIVDVTGSELTVGTVAGTSRSNLIADATDAGAPVMVTVGTITESDGVFSAFGIGASFLDQSATDNGYTYVAQDDGFVELWAAPATSSSLNYYGGTFALKNASATNAVAITGVSDGDVLELPGSSVSNVAFLANSLTVTTNVGTYAFTNVSYGQTITSYSAAYDPATGLEAITFGPDVFQANVAATSGPLAGDYLWSNSANWSYGVPAQGDSVSVGPVTSYDNIESLDLAALSVSGGPLLVTGSVLTVSAVASAGGLLYAEAAEAAAPVTVTVGTITGTDGEYGAVGRGAIFLDQSAIDTGNIYNAAGGFFELWAAPASGSSLTYYDTSAFALRNPSATNAVAINSVAVGDVLELPGSSVSNVTFGANSLTVTTNAGTYAFTNVGYAQPVDSYTAANDPFSGLEAITFVGPDAFSDNVAATSGALAGQYLWSNSANWSYGAPAQSEASISSGAISVDDIESLDLASLTVSSSASVTLAANELSLNGALTNSGMLEIGPNGGSTPGNDVVNAASLDDTGGTIDLSGASSTQYAALNITGDGASLGTTPGLLSGNVSLTGYSLITFASGGAITELGAQSSLSLSGPNAQISALAGLATIDSTGSLSLDGGAQLTTGALTNIGAIDLDIGDYSLGVSAGGSSLTVDGLLTNLGTLDIGPNLEETLRYGDSVTAASLDNDGGTINLDGSLPFVAATLDVSGAFANNGTVNVDGDKEEIAGAVTGTGTFTVSSGSTLQFDSSVASGQIVTNKGGDVIALKLAPQFKGTIDGFSKSDSIDLTAISYDANGSANLAAGNVLEVTENGATYSLQLDPSQSFSNEYFHLASEAGGASTLITESSAPCYCPGTLILTDRGEVPVERLAIGDFVVTTSGEAKRIRWIGHRALNCSRHSDPKEVWPIRVSAGAFGEKIPSRDLWLSPGHNIAAEGVLMPIKALQNGKTVAQEERSTVEYWHVELDVHDIIIANGLPAESYLDTGNRTAFVNGGAFIEAHPDFKPKHWAATCLPLVFEGEEVRHTKARLLERLKGFGHGKTSEGDLHVMADGKRIDPLECGAMRFAFALPTGCADIRLMSRSFVPAHSLAESADTRSLGVCLRRLQIGYENIALDDETLLSSDWHDVEPGLRWTRGSVKLPSKTRLVVIELAGPGHYWRERKDCRRIGTDRQRAG